MVTSGCSDSEEGEENECMCLVNVRIENRKCRYFFNAANRRANCASSSSSTAAAATGALFWGTVTPSILPAIPSAYSSLT